MELDQLITWIVLFSVLVTVGTGRIRIDLAAMSGLIILGLAGVAPVVTVFSGFGNPALMTIVAVFFISQGIIDSGVMRGLGQKMAKKMKSSRGQIMELAAVTAILSAFMNNVGAVGLMLPTAVRMAKRSNSCIGSYGMPVAMAAILGGTMTLIGSAPNIIIASYMATITGQSFKMFDYAPHGLSMIITAGLIWVICKSCGLDPGAMQSGAGPAAASDRESVADQHELSENIAFAPLATREKRITFLAIVPAIIMVSLGLLHPAFGFGAAALILIVGGVLKLPAAYECIDLKIVFFLGAMLGIGQILEHTGALNYMADRLVGLAGSFSPFWLILLLVLISSALSNGINNAAAAVFMAPLAVSLAAGSAMPTTAALMAVAAGANLTLILPTHQAALMVMSKAPFSTSAFIRFGLLISIFCALAASVTIALVWQ